jgi:hypothetical protein
LHSIKGFLQAIQAKADDLGDTIRDENKSNDRVSEERSLEVHKRVNDAIAGLGELKGEMKQLTIAVNRLFEKGHK